MSVARVWILWSSILLSPHPHARFRREIQLSPRLNIECRVPSVEVAHGVGAILIGWVTICRQKDSQKLRPHLRAPALGIRNEETLIVREAFLRCLAGKRGRLTCIRGAIRVIGSGQSGHVGNALA